MALNPQHVSTDADTFRSNINAMSVLGEGDSQMERLSPNNETVFVLEGSSCWG